MDILKFALLFILAVPSAWAGSEDSVTTDEHAQAVEAQSRMLCHSTDEYIATLNFLRTDRTLIFTENTARKVAEKVSSGCDGAAKRFSKILLLMTSVGVSDRGSLDLALQFAAYRPEVQKNFSEIFTHAFLAEFFNYDYKFAAALAYELSRDYHGDPVTAREDFLDLVHYCKNTKDLDMPAKLCAELTIKYAHLSQYFADGVRGPFHKLFDTLRLNHDFSMSVKTALDVTYNVLKNGPQAPDNFLSGYKYATSKGGLNLTQREAIVFAMTMAERSFIGAAPPVISAPSDSAEPELKHAANP